MQPSEPGLALTAEAVVSKHAIFAASIGTAVEYYDLFVYLFFSATIAKLFFPLASPFASLLATVGTYGLSFLAKPLGALIFSNYADRVSRKSALTVTLSLMAIGVGMSAFTPTYMTIGIAATIIMFLARLVQAFSTGGEYATSTAFLVDRAPQRLRGFYSSFNIAALGITSVLAGFVGLLVNKMLTTEEIANWGWRIPFVLGLAIIPCAVYLRRAIPDIDLDKRQTSKTPLRAVLREHKVLLLLCIGGFILVTVSNYVLAFYLPTYAVKNLGLSSSVAFSATMMFGVLQCVLSPVFGYASDIYGRKTVMNVAAGGLIILTLPCFLMVVASPSAATLIASELLLCVFATAYQAPMPAFLCDLFPAGVRATSVAIVHDFTATAIGGFTPFFVTLMIGVTGSNLVPGVYVLGASVLGLACVVAIRAPKATFAAAAVALSH